jgi:hypothetical protein
MDNRKRPPPPAADEESGQNPQNKTGPKSSGRQKRAKGQPSRPLSAYNYFFKDTRLEVLQEMETRGWVDAAIDGGGDKKTSKFRMLGKIIGKRWKELPPDQREKYEIAAKADMDRYRPEMDAYNDAMIRDSSIGKKNRLADDRRTAVASLPQLESNIDQGWGAQAGIASAPQVDLLRSAIAAATWGGPLPMNAPVVDHIPTAQTRQPPTQQQIPGGGIGNLRFSESDLLIAASQQAESARLTSLLGNLPVLQQMLWQQEQSQASARLLAPLQYVPQPVAAVGLFNPYTPCPRCQWSPYGDVELSTSTLQLPSPSLDSITTLPHLQRQPHPPLHPSLAVAAFATTTAAAMTPLQQLELENQRLYTQQQVQQLQQQTLGDGLPCSSESSTDDVGNGTTTSTHDKRPFQDYVGE